MKRLDLLTTTAGSYFASRGFHRVERDSITGGLRESAEFRGACPDSAVCMEMTL